MPMLAKSDTSATNASLKYHFCMVEAHLCAARDAFSPTLGLLPDAQGLGTTQSGLPKQPDASGLAVPDILRLVARCQVGNVNLGYAYELGFKLLIRLDPSANETFSGKDGHDLDGLYNKLCDCRQRKLTEWDHALGKQYIDYRVQTAPTGTKPPQDDPGKKRESVSLGERLGKLQRDGFLLDSRYKHIEQPYLPHHVLCPHWTWKTMKKMLTDMIQPELDRQLSA